MDQLLSLTWGIFETSFQHNTGKKLGKFKSIVLVSWILTYGFSFLFQESCWWQPESENWTLPSSRSGGLPDESTVPGFARSRPPVWPTRQVENGGVITNVSALNSQNSQDVNGDVFKEKLVLDSDQAANRFPNHRSEWGGTGISSNSWGPTTPATATLLEAQESGELMAHMDEANFALDGLKPGQPLRVQRASLQSLLSLCGSMQRRRLLRTHGYFP